MFSSSLVLQVYFCWFCITTASELNLIAVSGLCLKESDFEFKWIIKLRDWKADRDGFKVRWRETELETDRVENRDGWRGKDTNKASKVKIEEWELESVSCRHRKRERQKGGGKKKERIKGRYLQSRWASGRDRGSLLRLNVFSSSEGTRAADCQPCQPAQCLPGQP